LSYDQANRLTAYGSAGTYAYNGDGLRMSKTVSGATSQFLWDVAGNLPLLIKDGSVAYLYGPGGLPLEQISGSTAVWLHHDQLGSTRLVTDGTGTNKATYTFDAYGNVTATTGTITNPLRFASQYQDVESGFYFLRVRYYDPATGQFLSRDPAIPTRPFGYAADNPLNWGDPTGLDVAPAPSGDEPPRGVEGDMSTWDFNNPKQCPGRGWEWRGAPGSQPGGANGNWWNPKTGESLWGDPNNGPPKGPHWDYRKRGIPGKGALQPNGNINWSIDDPTPLPITATEIVIGASVIVVIGVGLTVAPEITLPALGYLSFMPA